MSAKPPKIIVDDADQPNSPESPKSNVSFSDDLVLQKTKDSNRTPSIVRGSSHHKINSAPLDLNKISSSKPRKRISSQYSSHSYHEIENKQFLEQQEKITPSTLQKISLIRWLVNFLVGAYVAVIAFLVYILIKYVSKAKFLGLYALSEKCEGKSWACLFLPGFVWVLINCALITLGSYLVTYHAPHAAGSGIPQIKCYLNGIRLPGLLSLKTMIAKAGGVILSVTGGLACGKEGPMIHSGAICASGMARGDFSVGKCKAEIKAFRPLRSDPERRDFVAAGAASGVSAAFGAPIGGVLFSLEEGASFLSQTLTWRMLFSSMTASLLLNIFMSALKGHPENMSNPGLVSFGMMGDISYKTFELPIFMVMALIGGLSGAAFNFLNYHVTVLRRKYIKDNWKKVAEAVLVAASSAIILLVMIYSVPNCSPVKGFNATSTENSTSHSIHKRAALQENSHGNDNHSSTHTIHYGEHGDHGYIFRGNCPYGQHNRMADILFKTPEGGLHAMLHEPWDYWDFKTLAILFVVYHLLATWTYGLMVSSGVFIPSLLIGGLYGRIIGMAVIKLLPAAGTNIGKYVLVGAACQLGGTVRMTISLTVIVIECTGDITFGLPIMLSLIIAKWMGDFFNPGIYDLHIEILGIPLLPWEPPEMCYDVKARDVMSTPVLTMRKTELANRIHQVLNEGEYLNGFPVVREYESVDNEKAYSTYGKLCGFITQEQLKTALEQSDQHYSDLEATIDLEPFMDTGPFTILEDVSLPKIFKLFRGLGMRHLTVVDEDNRVIGIITRQDLARYRSEVHKGKFKFEELHVIKE